MIENYVKRQESSSHHEPEGYAVLTEADRLELIDALKAKWDTVNGNYQKITHLVQLDSLGQVPLLRPAIARFACMNAVVLAVDSSKGRYGGLA